MSQHRPGLVAAPQASALTPALGSSAPDQRSHREYQLIRDLPLAAATLAQDGSLQGKVPPTFAGVPVTSRPARAKKRGGSIAAQPLPAQPRRLLQDDPDTWLGRSGAQASVSSDLLGLSADQYGPVFTEHTSDEAGYDASDPSPSMQVSDLLKASPLTAMGGRAKLEERIEALARSGSKMAPASAGLPSGQRCVELDAEDRARLAAALADDALSGEELRDTVSTALMDGFRKHTGKGTFGLLYELNAAQLLVQVAGRLRRYSSKADAGDVLQEVFFNVYRYPHRFDSSRDDAFRVWTAMIVRNTVLKHLRSRSTGGGNRREIPFEDLSDQPVAHSETPLSGALQNEANLECSRAYVVYLQLYIEFYTMLSERERRALHLVEVDGVSYREAAASLGIKLENLKMVIFRARKKIHRAMRRVFDGLSPDCKPARIGTPKGSVMGSSGSPIGSHSDQSSPGAPPNRN